jgi:acyl phosphate:glycerol-3-phosphate acyltransferase
MKMVFIDGRRLVALQSAPILPKPTPFERRRFADRRLDKWGRNRMLATVAIVVAAYLIGSISFAVVVSRAFRLPDPHQYGSGNPGATNVLRTGNKAAALLTMLGDLLKGLVVVLAARALGASDWVIALAALAAFVGHVYPVFHRFAGGKGVATAAGIVLGIHWPLGLLLTLVWLTLAFGFKISSLAALVTALLLPIGMLYATGPGPYALASVAIGLLVFWRHRTNIRQLIAGNERSIGR